eukprot:8960867-Lingulodinium_polyedra.AAC.1
MPRREGGPSSESLSPSPTSTPSGRTSPLHCMSPASPPLLAPSCSRGAPRQRATSMSAPALGMNTKSSGPRPMMVLTTSVPYGAYNTACAMRQAWDNGANWYTA